MSVKQTARIISTYAADVSGVASALYELGGMTVLHDASGCNSTYNTHDEPRWYDCDSLVFISGLTETEAIMGDDEKLIGDICSAAASLRPAFVAIAGTPIPMLTGTDLPAVASLVEKRTGIPSFGLPTNSMHSYISGVSLAFAAVVSRFVKETETRRAGGVNILGATPLDFSLSGTVSSVRRLLEKNGFDVISCLAMDDTLANISRAGEAEVNLVISASGLAAARELKARFGTPFTAALPCGEAFSESVVRALRESAKDGTDRFPCAGRRAGETVIIGESVISGSLAAALTARGLPARVVCPVETEAALLAQGDTYAPDEDDILPALAGAKTLIADPLYKPLCPAGTRFVPLPHEAFSGRIFRKDIPDLTKYPDNFTGGKER